MSFGNRAGSYPLRNASANAGANTDAVPVVVGEVLAGKYRVERVLGAGGMGVVVAARHLQLDQLVALKFVLPSALEDGMVTERFLREAKAAVRLKSEHVAKVLDVGTLETGAPYIVMEYLEGSNLAEVIGLQAPLSADVACDYLIQACEALSEAHTLGVIHRDLKPQNLFLTKGIGGAALVKVLDFGISKVKQAEGVQNLTQTATVIGSPLYMAPEQMRSARSADQRSDIWALGVVLYEMLSRSLPFEAETITDLAIKIVQEPFAPLEQLRPDLPRELVAAVSRCLAKSPADRFQDMGELASALEPFATAMSRVIADRTRKVISAHSKTMGMSVAPALSRAEASGPVRAVAVSGPTQKSPSMPEAWSETKGKTPQKPATWLVAVSAAGLTLVLGYLGLRVFNHPPPPAIQPITTTAGPSLAPPDAPVADPRGRMEIEAAPTVVSASAAPSASAPSSALPPSTAPTSRPAHPAAGPRGAGPSGVAAPKGAPSNAARAQPRW